MTSEQLSRIEEYEKLLSFLISPNMTTEEKRKALSDSFFRSHNAGFCDYMAGIEMSGVENAATEQWDLDLKYKYEVEALLTLLEE